MKPRKTTPADALMAMGIRRLLDNHPLLGGLLAQWRVFEGRVGTMAVGWDGSRISLIYEPDFVSSLTMVQLENVLMHEVRHVIYGHCFMDPADWPDRQALVIAQEVTVNEGLDDLPGDPIVLEDYACLKPNTDTHERYAVLAVDMDDGPNGQKGDDGPGQAPKDSPAHEDGQEPVPGQSEPGDDGASPEMIESDGASGKNGKMSPLDDHASWGDLLDNRSQIAADLRGAISQILAKTQDLKDDEQDAERASSSLKICGTQAGSCTTVLGAKRRQITTQQLYQMLAQMGGSSRDRGARFDRPPRRAPELLGIIPTHALMRNRVIALAVIDTSGSIDDATLASVAAVLRRIEDVAELTVVECDAAIQRVYPFNGAVRKVVGRGGTSFCPPLERVFLAKTGAEAVIYFTDGCGPAPETPPHIPIIWALTHGGEPPCDWGKVLRVESE